MISIIVPVFRVEEYIRRCLDSILAQTYTDFEAILIDDGSDDGCPAICDEYAEKDARFRVIHQKNRGASAARNAGLDAAKGEFITCIDPDDWVSPDMLKRMVSSIGGCAMCCGGYKRVTEWGIDPLPEACGAKIIPASRALLNTHYRKYVAGKLYRRSAIGDIRFPVGMNAAEDRVFFAMFLTERPERQVAVIDDVLYYYFIRGESETQRTGYSDLPAIELMLKRAHETRDPALVEYLLQFLKAKEETGYHIGDPPDYARVKQLLKECLRLGEHVLPLAKKIKYLLMIRCEKGYVLLSKAKRSILRH